MNEKLYVLGRHQIWIGEDMILCRDDAGTTPILFEDVDSAWVYLRTQTYNALEALDAFVRRANEFEATNGKLWKANS